MISRIFYSAADFVKTMLDEEARYVTLISVLDSPNDKARPDLTRFLDTLPLSFHDICEEEFGENEPWEDNLDKENVPTLTDAHAILGFFEKHSASNKDTVILVHCFAGVSRSAAIALWLGEISNTLVIQAGPSRIAHPNPRVIRLLNKAHFERYGVMPNPGPYGTHKDMNWIRYLEKRNG